jgi:hypothetical protein
MSGHMSGHGESTGEKREGRCRGEMLVLEWGVLVRGV